MLIIIIAIIVAINAFILYCCCVMAGRTDEAEIKANNKIKSCETITFR